MKSRIVEISCTLAASLIWSVLSGGVLAADACHSILAYRFYGEYPRIAVAQRDRALYAELCSLDFSKANGVIKRAQSSDSSMGLTYGLINLDDFEQEAEGGQAGAVPAPRVSEERFMQWKSGYCAHQTEVSSYQAAEFFMQKVAKDNASLAKSAEDWTACMRKREGLACWASPHASGSEEAFLNVSWTKGAGQPEVQPEVTYSFLTRGGISKFKDAEARRILPEGYRLSPGTLQIPITRPADKGVYATLKVSHADKEHSCKVFLPGEKDFPLLEPFINRTKLKYPG